RPPIPTRCSAGRRSPRRCPRHGLPRPRRRPPRRMAERAPLLECPRVASRVLGAAVRAGWADFAGARAPDGRSTRGPPGDAVDLTNIWYIVGFMVAGVSFVFLTIGAAWLISHRNRGDAHKGLPY